MDADGWSERAPDMRSSRATAAVLSEEEEDQADYAHEEATGRSCTLSQNHFDVKLLLINYKKVMSFYENINNDELIV